MTGSQYLEPASAFARAPLPSVKDRATAAAQQMQHTVQSQAAKSGIGAPQYDLLELIGKGAFGRVYRSKYVPNNQLVAVKIIDVDNADFRTKGEDTVKDVLRETGALRALKESNAKNINIIYDAFFFGSCVWIVSEYCPGGSVRTLMRATPQPGLNEEYIIPIARELAEALKWVHSAGIIHRDIKAANVLICEDGRVQLCDFGVAGILESRMNKRSTILGTPHYMAPEILEVVEGPVGVEYGNEVDIWAFGCTLYELATGLPPNARVPHEHLSHVVKNQVPKLKGNKHSTGLQDLIQFCMERSPNKRPTIELVQDHPYIVNTDHFYPTSSLRRLLYDYYVWERSGGQRSSLFMPGGAQVPEFLDEEDDDWNFSTTEFFKETVAAGNLAPDAQTPRLGSTGDIQFDRAQGGPSQKVESHPRIPLNPLQRLFLPHDNYNYLERGQRAKVIGTSDLPLREHNENSSRRETLIDAGSFDASTGIATIPDLSTIRGKPTRYTRLFSGDSDEESEETVKFQESNDDATRRATKDWKFPKFNVSDEADESRRRTQDWKFPLNLPEGSANDRRKTRDWKFPVMTSEKGPGPSRPTAARPGPTAPLRPGLMHAHTEPVDSAAFGAHRGPTDVGNTPSSPHSTIDLDEYFASSAHGSPGAAPHMSGRNSFAAFMRGDGDNHDDKASAGDPADEFEFYDRNAEGATGAQPADAGPVASEAEMGRRSSDDSEASDRLEQLDLGGKAEAAVSRDQVQQASGAAAVDRRDPARAETKSRRTDRDEVAAAAGSQSGGASGAESTGHGYTVSSESNTTDDDVAPVAPLPRRHTPPSQLGRLPPPPDPKALSEGAPKDVIDRELSRQLDGWQDTLSRMRALLETEMAASRRRIAYNDQIIAQRAAARAVREKERQETKAFLERYMQGAGGTASLGDSEATPTSNAAGSTSVNEGAQVKGGSGGSANTDDEGKTHGPTDVDK